jgi:tryptophan 2,3-dioxygenase
MTRNEMDTIIEPGASTLTYDKYLKVRALLDLQEPLSKPEQHDELLFIIIHQAYELWFKQILHEIEHAAKMIEQDQVMPFVRALTRITTIQDVLTKQVDILETMTPADFNRFRDRLNPASGFQSFQFRVVEFKLGAKEPAYLKFFKHEPKIIEALQSAIQEPTLYDRVLHHLARRGFEIPHSVLDRDVTKPYEGDETVVDALAEIYEKSESNYDLYMLVEKLVDLDQKFLLWRYRHVAMVERMIGNRKGTGGSSGVKYLTSTLQKRAFPDVWEVRNRLGITPYGG